MIDDIIERILTEVRGRDREDVVSKVYSVMREIDLRIMEIINKIRAEERRKREDENKNRNQKEVR